MLWLVASSALMLCVHVQHTVCKLDFLTLMCRLFTAYFEAGLYSACDSAGVGRGCPNCMTCAGNVCFRE